MMIKTHDPDSARPSSENSPNQRRKIFRKFYSDQTLTAPACRTVVLQTFFSRESFRPDAKCEFVSLIHPVVAIESRIEHHFWAFADEHPNGSICFATVAGFAKAGCRLSNREVVHGALFTHPDYGLVSTLDVTELCSAEEKLTIAVCPWSEMCDNKQLRPIIDELKSKAMKCRQEFVL